MQSDARNRSLPFKLYAGRIPRQTIMRMAFGDLAKNFATSFVDNQLSRFSKSEVVSFLLRFIFFSEKINQILF